MEIIFYTKNVKLTSELEAYAREKVSKLEKYLKNIDIQETKIELTEYTAQRKGNKFVAEVDVILPKGSLRASEATTDIHASIDMVIPKLKKEIAKYKGKWEKQRREGRKR
ncbi:MAG: ribosome-associated translation inhibitor RaiA [Parcubacteria group bacterium]|nr:ribosome-associated translation inhibitor RaiA [Parcubacteria group bacterium]